MCVCVCVCVSSVCLLNSLYPETKRLQRRLERFNDKIGKNIVHFLFNEIYFKKKKYILRYIYIYIYIYIFIHMYVIHIYIYIYIYWIVLEIGSRSPYNCCFVGFEDLFHIVRSIPVQFSSSFFPVRFVSVHVAHPYCRINTIAKTIQKRRTKHMGHCWRSKEELLRNVLLLTLAHGRASVGRPTKTYLKLLCNDT